MAGKSLISVIMPSYNVGPYIRQCMESVITQTLRDIEIICIDSGSSDGTLEILEEYAARDKRVTLLHSDIKSYGHQMNTGLAAAQGDYIGIVETDDFIVPNMYENLYKLSENGTADVVKGNFLKFFSDGSKQQFIPSFARQGIPEKQSFTVSEQPRILYGHPSVWSAIYRRSFLSDIGIRFIEEPGGGWVDNPFFYETLCAAKGIIWIDKPFYYYRQTNPNSSSNNLTDTTLPIRRMMDNLDVLDKYHITDREILFYAYDRAFTYIAGTIKSESFFRQEEQTLRIIQKLLLRLDRQIVDEMFPPGKKQIYYKYRSPLRLILPVNGKVLIVNDKPFDPAEDPARAERKIHDLIQDLLQKRPDLSVYFLVIPQDTGKASEKYPFQYMENKFGDRCPSFHIRTGASTSGKADPTKILEAFMESYGPFETVNIPSMPDPAFNISSLKEKYPSTVFCSSFRIEEISDDPKDGSVSIRLEDLGMLLEEKTFLEQSLGPSINAGELLKELQSGISYKLGRSLTKFPRKVKNMLGYHRYKK